MKTIIKHAICTMGMIGISFVSVGAYLEKAEIDSFDLPVFKVEELTALPVPDQSFIPIIPAGLAGTTLEMKFTVNKWGEAISVDTVKPLFTLGRVNDKEKDFACIMMNTIRRWDFDPALDERGLPVTVNVLMDVTVIKKGETPVAIVKISLDDNDSELS